MQSSAVHALLKYGTPAQRAGFAALLPHTPFACDTGALLDADRLDLAIVALGPAITTCCAGTAPEIGSVVAHAAHRCAIELLDSGVEHALLPGTAGTLACAFIGASSLLGRHEDVIEFTTQHLPYYRTAGDGVATRSLTLALAAALLQLDRLDEADAVLCDPSLTADAVTAMEVARLRTRSAQRRTVLDCAPSVS